MRCLFFLIVDLGSPECTLQEAIGQEIVWYIIPLKIKYGIIFIQIKQITDYDTRKVL